MESRTDQASRVINEIKGSYRCRVTNEFSTTDSEYAILDVYKLPRFTYTPRNKTLAAGQRVKLSCDAVGYPDPQISWSHSSHHWDRLDPSGSLGMLTVIHLYRDIIYQTFLILNFIQRQRKSLMTVTILFKTVLVQPLMILMR